MSGAAAIAEPSAGRAAQVAGGAGMSVALAGAGVPVAGRAAAPDGGSAAASTAGDAAGPAAMPGGDTAGAAAADAPDAASEAPEASACTREFLRATVDAYFAALAAHEPEQLTLADSVKFTENGEVSMLGEGLWANAGPVKFKESLFDPDQCGSVTQAVVPEGATDLPFALRLGFEAQKITEIETIAVRSGDYVVASEPDNMIALTSEAWEQSVPEAERTTREQLEGWIDKYFRQFPMGGCDLASDCRRMENGFTLACDVGATCSSDAPSGSAVMMPRNVLADVEAGLAAGFVMFQGRYTDVHMIKYVGQEVRGVHTILAAADSSGWD